MAETKVLLDQDDLEAIALYYEQIEYAQGIRVLRRTLMSLAEKGSENRRIHSGDSVGTIRLELIQLCSVAEIRKQDQDQINSALLARQMLQRLEKEGVISRCTTCAELDKFLKAELKELSFLFEPKKNLRIENSE